jgi:hypothetical protein
MMLWGVSNSSLLSGGDEPNFIPYAISLVCFIGAEGAQMFKSRFIQKKLDQLRLILSGRRLTFIKIITLYVYNV